MSAEEFGVPGTASALLFVVFAEPLPKDDCLRGIVTGSSHIDQADVVGFGFLSAAVGEFAAILRQTAVSRHENVVTALASGDSGAGVFADLLQCLGFAHAFGAMMRH